MIKLSPRLQAIADYIDDNVHLVDVGCDHGLLDIYLKQNKKNIHIIASDIRESALNQAINNIKKYHLEGKIETRLGNGLDVIKDNEIDTVIISGMGSNTIINILNNNKKKLAYINNLIIQSNANIYDIRKKVCNLGYYINSESLVKEKNFIYTIIFFKKGRKKNTRRDFVLGPYLIKHKNDIFMELLRRELSQNKLLLKLIPKQHFIKRYHINSYIKLIEKELNKDPR